MRQITRDTIGQAHEAVIKSILEDGIEVMTKHGITLEHPEGLVVKIINPLKSPVKSEAYSFPLIGMESYSKQLLSFSRSKFDYNCGNRWQDFFTPDFNQEVMLGDGDGQGFNQLEKMVIEEITKDPSSRRAVVMSIYPPVDYYKKHIPCISMLQFLKRNNELNMIVYIRSNDMLSAWGSDAYALSKVLEYISAKLLIAPGYLEIISVSAHIYHKRDAPELLKFRRLLNI